jgi:hypothetical protein
VSAHAPDDSQTKPFDYSHWRFLVPTRPAAALSALLTLSFVAMPLAARAQTVSAACKPVLDAHTKEISTPRHSYLTQTDPGKSPTSLETITTATKAFMRLNGKWAGGGVNNPQDQIDLMHDNLRNTKVYECQKLPDANIDGVATIVYFAHSDNGEIKTDTKLWVEKSTGLILREEIDMYSDPSARRHIVERSDYKNVQPPAGVK